MTVRRHYECNVSGDIYSDKKDVMEFDIKRRVMHPFRVATETVHISEDVLEEFEEEHGLLSVPQGLKFIGVDYKQDNEKIVGAVIPIHDGEQWFDRGDVVIENYDPFFEFVEERVLY